LIRDNLAANPSSAESDRCGRRPCAIWVQLSE